MDGEISVRSGHNIAHEVKATIRATDPRITDVLVHVEPAKPRDLGERFAQEKIQPDRELTATLRNRAGERNEPWHRRGTRQEIPKQRRKFRPLSLQVE